MLGIRLASIYGLPPCALGFCGQGVKGAPSILGDYLLGKKISLVLVRKALECFEALYPYCQLIAQANEVRDPLDYRVVEAYFLGNQLLEKVSYQDLKKLVLKDFCQPNLLSRQKAQKIADLIPKEAKPHHSFHTLIIGSVTGRVKFDNRVRDICRIGWGEVVVVKKGKLKVRYKPLKVRKGEFYLARPVEKEIRWYESYLPRVEKGQVVSFHWGRACQILGKRQEKNLEEYTLLNMRAVNERRK